MRTEKEKHSGNRIENTFLIHFVCPMARILSSRNNNRETTQPNSTGALRLFVVQTKNKHVKNDTKKKQQQQQWQHIWQSPATERERKSSEFIYQLYGRVMAKWEEYKHVYIGAEIIRITT